MTREEAEMFAAEWAAAFNEFDIEKILAHYDTNVLFISPRAKAVVGANSVHGKQALREYWNKALSRIESLKFVVDRVVWDNTSSELAIIYIAEINQQKQRVSENFTFGSDGFVVKTEVFHGADG